MSPFRTSLRYQSPWTIRLLTCHSKIRFETAAQASYRAWILSVIFFCHYKILRQNSVQQNCTTVIFTFVPKLVRPCCVILGFCIIYAYPITLFLNHHLTAQRARNSRFHCVLSCGPQYTRKQNTDQKDADQVRWYRQPSEASLSLYRVGQ